MAKVESEGAEYTLGKADSPDTGAKVTGKANIFGILNRNIRRSAAKEANQSKRAYNTAADKMLEGMSKVPQNAIGRGSVKIP